ncbi:MAG TPA: hypothetical protein VMI12_18890, partial [Puia sp.]|nr:hypothetical protein [Puia sp.]
YHELTTVKSSWLSRFLKWPENGDKINHFAWGRNFNNPNDFGAIPFNNDHRTFELCRFWLDNSCSGITYIRLCCQFSRVATKCTIPFLFLVCFIDIVVIAVTFPIR